MIDTSHETTAAVFAGTGAESFPWERLVVRAALALALLAATLWLGRLGGNLSDWTNEARPSVDALLDGHLGGFLERAPAYGGSLLLRAPFMELTRMWAGGTTAVYVAGALPCVAALMALGIWLSERLAEFDRGLLGRGATVAVCVANPIAIAALQQGHPEELLGAALCVAAVLCAQRGHAVWSGLLVGVATANITWGVLAAGPVLVAPPRPRVRAVAAMVAAAGLILAPFTLVGSSDLVSQTRAVGLGTGGIFNPWQLWWFLGSAHAGAGGGRAGPVWLSGLVHMLPIAVMPPLSLAYAGLARRSPGRRRRDALLLLALLLLLRCVLDPWDIVYYPVPFLTALLAWETTTYDRPPIIAGLASLVTWFVFEGTPYVFGSGHEQNILALVFTIASLAALTAIVHSLLDPSPVAGPATAGP